LFKTTVNCPRFCFRRKLRGLLQCQLYHIFPLSHIEIYKISKLKIIPRAYAKEVAEYAKAILDGDKAGRRRLYEKLGLPPDDSVK